MPVQREHLEEANVKRRETFQKQYLLPSFSLLAKTGAKEGQHAVVEQGSVSIEKINSNEEKTVKEY